MFCKTCGTEINGTAKFCPGCGAKVEQKPDSLVCPACGAHVKPGVKFCEDCGAALDGGRPGVLSPAQAPAAVPSSAPSLKPLPLPRRMPAGSAAPVAATAVTSATITDGAPIVAPMRKPEVGHQQTPRKASDRLKQQAGTAARQVAKTVFQKIMEIETPASSLPGETRTTLNSEQMSVLSTVARSLFRR